ncbi:MAG: selenoneine biosynthesis selenosugar synthase SenB [Pseudomonadota bacterium]
MAKLHIIIISPALAKANNGNWQTAHRWAQFLRTRYRVTLASEWDGAQADLIIALHARRSAPSLAAFAHSWPSRPAILVLTGTDLYRDIRVDASAQESLRLASELVILQEAGLDELDRLLRHKTRVIYQSAPALKPGVRNDTARFADVTMIGHLREEKDPQTFMRAAPLVRAARVRLTHIGAALDPALGAQAEATQRQYPHYRWLGNQPHAITRQILKRSRLLVITSTMEGGANVIIEAVTSGVPVLASDIAGNRGMLGNDYAGYFPLGDSHALAELIDRALTDPVFYDRLHAQSATRALLFSPDAERAAVLELVDNALNKTRNLHERTN